MVEEKKKKKKNIVVWPSCCQGQDLLVGYLLEDKKRKNRKSREEGI